MKTSFLKQPRRDKLSATPHKRSAVVAIFLTAVTLTLAFLTTACDPGYTEDVAIRNASKHYVTIIPHDALLNDSTLVPSNKVYTLAPNEEIVIEQLGGIGTASFDEGVNYFKTFYGDSVKLSFGGFGEDGLVREKKYYAWETDGISPYNFQSAKYTYEEKRNTGRVFHDLPHYGKLTFTITDEHYAEAVTMKR